MLHHLASRIFGTPLLVQRAKLDVILSVLGSRIGLPDLDMAMPQPMPRPSATSGQAGIAVIPVHGSLVKRTLGLEAASGLTSYGDIEAMLDAAAGDASVRGILLDLDSSGGEVNGCFELARKVRETARLKPVWAIANDAAFSAAYAIGCAADRLFVTETGGVGSIGVIALHIDQSVKDAHDGYRYTAITAGAHKNDYSPHEPLADAARVALQAEVDRLYDLFVAHVTAMRGVSEAAVRATEAALYFGPNAIKAGLADAVGTIDDALAQLMQSLSSPPTPVAVAARAGFFNHTKESLMNDRTDPAALDRPLADPAGSPSQSPAATLSVADAVEIAQICTLAGRADLIAGFLEANTAPATVRGRLLAAQAEASQEIFSRIAPDAARHAVSNPLIDAAKQLAAQSTKKEI